MNQVAQQFEQVHDAIANADRVLLVAHKKPDGDTLGSSSSVFNWLIREGKDVTAFCLDLPPKAFHYIDNIHRYTNDPSVFDRVYDVVIIFDSGDLRYCGVDTFIPRLPQGYLLINLDHHVTNTRYAQINIVMTEASSTAEVVHHLYEKNNVLVDSKMATSLLTGLLTDTSSFSNSATNPTTVNIASKMLSAGARHREILKSVMHNKTVDSLKIWGLALSRLRYNAQYDMVTTYFLQNDVKNASTETIEGISNFLNLVVAEADAIMVLRENEKGEVVGSLRSVSRDISKVAKLLGGGGHKKASGFTVKGRIEETEKGPRIVSS